MKLHTQMIGNVLVQACQVIAKLNGKNVALELVTEERRAEKSYKELNPTNKFPLLETPEGTLQETQAVAKFLASGSATLLGSNAVERAQIDQWLNWWQSGVLQAQMPAVYAILGRNEITQAAFMDSCKLIKENLRALDQALTGDFLVGGSATVADICLAAGFSLAFQLILDQGFTKAAPKACGWFARVSGLPEFVAIFGKIRSAKKSLKPVLKVEEKPKAKAQQAAAKPKAEDQPKKDVNPLEALPPTSFDLFNFKTLYVNHPDKAGEGWQEFMRQVDLEGYAFWHLHYEKFGKEGQVEYQFQNLLEGFLQRLDNFRKHAFGKICLLNQEPDLEIAGILLIRGQVIPQECHDHPQFEYMRPRKLDMSVEADQTLAREFFSSKDMTGTAQGLPVRVSAWHK